MKNLFLKFILIALFAPLFTACGIDGHNRAELKPVNENDERIWGKEGAKPRHYDGEAQNDPNRQPVVDSIRQKLYPR